MEHVSTARVIPTAHDSSASNTGPLVIITVLFFMWGLLTSLNDVLIPHLKAVYTLTYVQAMLVQFCFFGAYFIVSLPAGMLIKKIGYQNGAVAGLMIAAAGCAMFYPASNGGYSLFLLAFFILAGGITVLQVAANPYVTALGDPRTASSRLTLTQAFNSFGTTVAPTIGGLLILSGVVLNAGDLAKLPAAAQAAYHAHEAAAVQGPYLALAAALLALAVLFKFARLPKISHDDSAADALGAAGAAGRESALSHTNLVLGAIGIFLYVGGEVSHRQLPDQLHGRAAHRRPGAGRRRALRQLLLGRRDGGPLHRLRGDALRQPGQGPGVQRGGGDRAGARRGLRRRPRGDVVDPGGGPVQLDHVPDHLQHGPVPAR